MILILRGGEELGTFVDVLDCTTRMTKCIVRCRGMLENGRGLAFSLGFVAEVSGPRKRKLRPSQRYSRTMYGYLRLFHCVVPGFKAISYGSTFHAA